MSSNPIYYTYALPQPVQPEPAPLKAETECDSCGGPIALGEDAVEVFMGVIGRGQKSGQLMVVDDPREQEWPVAKLHRACVRDFAANFICEEESEEHFCQACGVELEE